MPPKRRRTEHDSDENGRPRKRQRVEAHLQLLQELEGLPADVLDHVFRPLHTNILNFLVRDAHGAPRVSLERHLTTRNVTEALMHYPGEWRNSTEALSVLGDLLHWFPPSEALHVLLERHGLRNAKAFGNMRDYLAFFDWCTRLVREVPWSSSEEVPQYVVRDFVDQLIACVLDDIIPGLESIARGKTMYPHLISLLVEAFNRIVSPQTIQSAHTQHLLKFAIAMAYRERNLYNDAGFGNILLVNIMAALRDKAGSQEAVNQIVSDTLITEAASSDMIYHGIGHDLQRFIHFVRRISGRVN